MARALESRDMLSHAIYVFASLVDQVREKKDVPLGPEDPKEEDGSFDYRCVISLASAHTQRPLSVDCPRCPEWCLPLRAVGLAHRPLH